MYTAFVLLGFGTGAPEHRYATGRGLAMCKSPKQAYRLARQQALRNAGDGAAWCPILVVTDLSKVD